MSNPRSVEELVSFMKDIEYPGFEFAVKTLDAEGWHPYIQVRCEGTCNKTGEPMKWHGRKWLVSPWATEGEIVQTSFLAVMTALEHEARENFKFKGQAVLDPHYDPWVLWKVRQTPGATVEREKPATKENI